MLHVRVIKIQVSTVYQLIIFLMLFSLSVEFYIYINR